MDKESISRLGLDYISNIDVDSSDEIYDPSTTNHIIILKVSKQIFAAHIVGSLANQN